MKKLDEAALREAADAYNRNGGNKTRAAEELGLAYSTYCDRLNRATSELGLTLARGKVEPIRAKELKLPGRGRVKRYILTSAQNNTLIMQNVWMNLKALAEHYGAQIMVGTFTYNKATYGKRAVKRGSLKASDFDNESWYDPEIEPFIVDERVQLAPGLVWCAEKTNILPTAEDPLSGLETYTGRASGIFPHVKHEMRSIASGKFEATKFNWTTGAITQRNYIQKKAGMKAEFHHVYGALIVEVDEDGDWWVRQLNASSDDAVQDLDVVAHNGEVTTGNPVEAITWGDIHADQMDGEVKWSAWGDDGMLDALQPRYQFMHDLIGFSSGQSHHDRKKPSRRFEQYAMGRDNLADEMRRTAMFLDYANRPWCHTVVVKSNHDAHLVRWLDETTHHDDQVNAVFYLRTALPWYEYMEARGAAIKARNEGEDVEVPPPFNMTEAVLRAAGAKEPATFLLDDEPFVICHDKSGGIECGYHGDKGANGVRGTPSGLSKFGRKMTIGDKHSCEIRHGLFVAGLSAQLDLGYNTGPSGWSHSHVVTYPNGKRTMVTMWNGKWRA